MQLILEIVSQQTALVGADRRRIVGIRGLSIGRVAGNDWVIPDPFVSRQHAQITYRGGQFYLESLGSNSVAIGAPDRAVPKDRPHRLQHGDHIFIEQYEILATISEADQPNQGAPASPGLENDAITDDFRELLSTQSTADAGYMAGNDIGRRIDALGDRFIPNIPALIEIYLRMYPFLDGPRKEWLATRDDILIFFTHPYLAFGWQIAWAISRATASEITAHLSRFSASTEGNVRSAISDLQEDIYKYAYVKNYPMFGGGSGPPDPIAADSASLPLRRSPSPAPRPAADFDTLLAKEVRPREQVRPRAEEQSPAVFDVTTPSVSDGVVYPVWFGTNRTARADGAGYTSARSHILAYGQVRVHIPEAHRFGETGQPFWKRLWRLDLRNDLLRVQTIEARDRDLFYSEIGQTMEIVRETGAQPCALLFIHGYNVSFQGAAIRAAQIGYDLRIEGATAFFSWPSHGVLGGYAADAATIEASEPLITEFLIDFAKHCGAAKVHVVAHSMGNRGLLRAMQRIAANSEVSNAIQLDQIILAAPDIDRDLFLSLAHLYPRFGRRTTLYTSNSDLPVRASMRLHGAPRAGYFPPYTVTPYAETIAVPDFDVDLLGHGYFAEAEALLHDIYDLVRNDTPPARRQRVKALECENLKLWQLRR